MGSRNSGFPPVLWLTPQATIPPRSGGTLRTYHLARDLAERTALDLVVVGTHSSAQGLKDAIGARHVRTFEPLGGSALRALCLRKAWPIAVGRAWHPAVPALVSRADRDRAVVVLDFVQMHVYQPRRPYVLHVHNAEAALLHALPRPETRRRRLELAWEKLTMTRWERVATRAPGATVVTVSDDDARRLNVDAIVVPNGTVLQPPRTPPAVGIHIFVGSMDYPPNVAAVRWWADRVWPLLPPGTPRLSVAGRGGTRVLSDLERHPGVSLLGEVDDLQPLYQRAQLAIVPLQHAGGTRLKILEALANSVPTLSTTVGAAGLGLRHGEDLWLADTPEDFASAVTRLASDAGLRRRLAQGGREAVAACDWTAVAQRLADVVQCVDSTGPR